MRSLIKHGLTRTEPTADLHVAGWVRTRRDSKAFSFLELNDGTCLGNLQIVADAGIPGYESISKMNTTPFSPPSGPSNGSFRGLPQKANS